jgi:hypothetical protein
MIKLVLHLVVASLLVALGQRAHWPWWLTLGAVVGGITAVHLVFERLLGGTRHLGAATIADDDPLMVDAMAEAKRTWPRFLLLYADHPKDTVLKYRIRTKAGDVENVWGDLLELGGESATVYLRTPPVGAADIPDRRMVVPLAEVVDWQVMMPDGSLRGGFTQQATFRIIERESGRLDPRFAAQLQRYRPVSDRAA